MGADVEAYKKWEKIEVNYSKPKMEKEIIISKEDKSYLSEFLYNKYKKFLHFYILDFIGYYKDCNYSEEDILRQYKKAIQLKDIIIENQELSSRFQYLVNIIEEGYSLATLFENKEKKHYAFKELIQYPKVIWNYDEYIDVEKFPNREIIDAFELIKEKFQIDLSSYIIDITDTEYIDDKKAQHNIQEAIDLVEKVIELNINNIPIYDKSAYIIYLNEVLLQCLKVWKQGGKLTVSY